MHVGIQLSLKPPAQQFELVQRIEALGFESVWTGDHVSFHGPIHESLTLLATFVPITRRIRLGTAVYLLALRAPAIAAKATATLDVLSGGRLIFGVGVGGENPKEFEVCGVPHRERGPRVTEGIDVVRALWRDSPASFDGRFTKFDSVSIDPRPVQQPGPPIWIGGRSDAALARAGRQGDGWVSYVVQPERYAQSVDKIRAAAQAAGRRLDGFAFAHLGFITLGRDWESAKAVWVRHLSRRYAQDFEPLARKYGIIGTPEQCAEQLTRFATSGCTYLIANPIGDPKDERDQIERLAADVLPLLAAGGSDHRAGPPGERPHAP
jgi:probable F420-dependent oxidoreductase